MGSRNLGLEQKINAALYRDGKGQKRKAPRGRTRRRSRGSHPADWGSRGNRQARAQLVDRRQRPTQGES